MPWLEVIWDYEKGGNVEHVAEHGISPQEVRYVLENPDEQMTSKTSGLPMVTGHAEAGRLIAVVFQPMDEFTVLPITAYELD